MFERYTEPARRAIFYARAVAVLNAAPAIDPSHLLYGLMWGGDSRAQTLFRLREVFPLFCGCPHKFADLKAVTQPEGPPLTYDSKKIVARAAMQADSLLDGWIDTEHLLLGILAEPACLAAKHLRMAGITLKNARQIVLDNKPSRPDYGPVPTRPEETPSRLKRLMFKWRTWRSRMGGPGGS
jgi:ATP-dependent Clp protease ATP-binding subunit ClpA